MSSLVGGWVVRWNEFQPSLFMLFMKTSNLSLTNAMRLKAAKKVMRETSHAVRPVVAVDKRKKASKTACRKWRADLK